MAASRPMAVAIRASAIPGATLEMLALCAPPMAMKEFAVERGGHGAAAVVDDDVRVVEAVAVELHELAEAVGEDALDAFGVSFFVAGVEDFEVAA